MNLDHQRASETNSGHDAFDQYNPATCLEPVCQHPQFGLVTVADMNEILLNRPDATGRQLLNFLMTTGGTPC